MYVYGTDETLKAIKKSIEGWEKGSISFPRGVVNLHVQNPEFNEAIT